MFAYLSNWWNPDTSITWKNSSGRSDGNDGYVFGDVSRTLYQRYWNQSARPMTDKENEEHASTLQTLMKEAIALFKRRRYDGTITINQTIGYFSESMTVTIDDMENPEDCNEILLECNKNIAGIFSALVHRLTSRAKAWNIESINPKLTSSVQLGFRAPLINVGWAVSLTFTISRSSLLRWEKLHIDS